MFFVLRDNWRTLLFIKVLDFFKRAVVAFFEASVLREVRILCAISTMTVQCY